MSIFMLIMWHLIVDFLCQTEKTALAKSKNIFSLLDHSWKYAALVAVLANITNCNSVQVVLMFFVLFISHIIIDSYYPSLFWFKYVRQMEILQGKKIKDCGEILSKNIKENPITAVLFIIVDQIFHLIVLMALLACNSF